MSRTEARRGINIQIPTKLIKFPSSMKRGHDLHNSSRVDVRYRFPEDRCGVNKTKFKTEYRYRYIGISPLEERSNRAHVSLLTKFTSIYGVENGSTSASNITEITGQIAFTLHVR